MTALKVWLGIGLMLWLVWMSVACYLWWPVP